MKTYFFKSLLDISADILKQLNTECVLLDIDNTIKPYGADCIDSKYVNWINNVKAYGIRVVLCSNNFYKNVRPIAELAGCDFVSFCLKPSPYGYIRAYFKFKLHRKSILVIGDQFFTDILGSKLLFLKAFMVEPISLEAEGTTVKLRRKLTSGFTNRIKARVNPYIKEE